MGTNYIIIGDSITYGIGDFQNGGWATMFKNYIVNKDTPKYVIIMFILQVFQVPQVQTY